MISEIVFKAIEGFESYYTDTHSVVLKNLSQINFFVGSNNSGKSRFLRSIYKEPNLGYNYKQIDMIALRSAMQQYQSNIDRLFKYPAGNEKYIPGFSKIEMPYAMQRNNIKSLSEMASKLESSKNEDWNRVTLLSGSNRTGMNQEYIRIVNSFLSTFAHLLSQVKYFEGEYIYIPILRGLRPLNEDKGTSDVYGIRTEKDYFKGINKEKHKIYTGQTLYNDLTQLLLGDGTDRQKVRLFEKFLSEEFFNNQEVNLIPKYKDDVVHVKIGREEFGVHSLGDGIQSLIIMLYPLFFNTGKQLQVFIEEPENSLHPGFQRLFIETLHKKEFKDFQFFITTHSNHFLDLTEEDNKDISIYTFEKKEFEEEESKFAIHNVSRRDMRSLELLGVRSSSVFLSNCTIWVEGITDRLYIAHYLDIYQDYLISRNELEVKYKEDIHYSFVEYAGANITHWSFSDSKTIDAIKAVSISTKIFLIADSDDTRDNPNSEKAKRLNRLQSALESNFYKHKSREIENTLHEEVLLRTIASRKNKNVEDIRPTNFVQTAYSNKKLGQYLKNKFSDPSYEDAYGSLNDKKKFCKEALRHIKSADDLSKEAKLLCAKIISFIQKSQG